MPQIRFALNTSIHWSVIDQSFTSLVHQFDFPMRLTERSIYDKNEPSVLRGKMLLIWNAAEEASSKARAAWTWNYNKQVGKNVALREGPLVLTKVCKWAYVLSPRWSGPAMII